MELLKQIFIVVQDNVNKLLTLESTNLMTNEIINECVWNNLLKFNEARLQNEDLFDRIPLCTFF